MKDKACVCSSFFSFYRSSHIKLPMKHSQVINPVIIHSHRKPLFMGFLSIIYIYITKLLKLLINIISIWALSSFLYKHKTSLKLWECRNSTRHHFYTNIKTSRKLREYCNSTPAASLRSSFKGLKSLRHQGAASCCPAASPLKFLY